MNEEIQKKLQEFREYQQKAQQYTIAHEIKPGQPIHMITGREMMLYDKWHTKMDIALNEFHQLIYKRPDNHIKLAESRDELTEKHKELTAKLERIEVWFKEHKE